jgi:hypothetical protein
METKTLTSLQIEVLTLIRAKGLHWIAGATEDHWRRGEEYYIDDRVNAKGIRRKFAQANRQASGRTK